MLVLEDVKTWLEANDVEGVVINWLPDTPDAAVAISVAPGTGAILDGAFEGAHVYVRSRGTTDTAAEATAKAVHELIVAQEGSFQMAGTYCLSIEAPAGPPSFLGRDDKQRTTYLCTYLLTVPS